MPAAPSVKFFPWLSLLVPILGWATLAAASQFQTPGAVLALVLLVMLGGSVFSAVHYAEVVACKVGEPFGTLVLAIAVTVIEVALIVSVLLTHNNPNLAVARDTIFSAVMIVCAGVVGACITVGALRHRVQGFNIKGSTGALSVLIALTVLTMVLPVFTSRPEDVFSTRQLIFVGVIALLMYGCFVFVQTVRHREYFMPEEDETLKTGEAPHATPTTAQTVLALGVLVFCLITVVALAKSLSPTIESLVDHAGLPKPVVGLAIAGFVLLPESVAAIRAAWQNKLQNSINLAFGSVISSIGLTIPVVAAVSVALGNGLILGLDDRDIVLFTLVILLNMITIQTGRTNILQGWLLLLVFASFLFFSVFP